MDFGDVVVSVGNAIERADHFLPTRQCGIGRPHGDLVLPAIDFDQRSLHRRDVQLKRDLVTVVAGGHRNVLPGRLLEIAFELPPRDVFQADRQRAGGRRGRLLDGIGQHPAEIGLDRDLGLRGCHDDQLLVGRIRCDGRSR